MNPFDRQQVHVSNQLPAIQGRGFLKGYRRILVLVNKFVLSCV